jgi:hypothetical protein
MNNYYQKATSTSIKLSFNACQNNSRGCSLLHNTDGSSASLLAVAYEISLLFPSLIESSGCVSKWIKIPNFLQKEEKFVIKSRKSVKA